MFVALVPASPHNLAKLGELGNKKSARLDTKYCASYSKRNIRARGYYFVYIYALDKRVG